MSYHHIIMRQRLEVEIPDKKYQQGVQARIQNLAEDLLNDLLDTTFSNVVPADVVISIDQLHVPLEAVDQAVLEAHISQQLQQKLLVAVQDEVHMVMQDPFKKRITPLPEAKLQAIKHYLLYGYFAWWMPITHESAIEDLYLEIYHENPNATRDLWLELSQHPAAIERFLSQFASSTIQLSLLLLHPTYASYLLELADDFTTLQPLVLQANHITRSAKLPTTLQHIVLAQAFQAIAHGRSIQEVTFLDACLQEVAQAFGMSYSVLLHSLSHELTSQPPRSFKTHIAHQVNRLYESQIAPSTHSTTKPITRLIKQLDRLLSQNTPIDNQQLDSTIQQLLTQSQDPTIRDLIAGYLRSSAQANRLTRYLSPAVFTQLIEAVQPNMASAFVLTKQLWGDFMPTALQADPLIERLTVQFLGTSPTSQQEEAAYIAYMMRQLPLSILTTLPPVHRPAQEVTSGSSQPPIHQYLLAALQKAYMAPQKHALTPAWMSLLATAHQAITTWLADIAPSKEANEQLQTTLQGIIQALVSDPQQGNLAAAQLDAWTQSLAKETGNKECQIATGALPRSLRDLAVTDLRNDGAFKECQVATGTTCLRNDRALTPRDALLPIPQELRKGYYALFTKADVLRSPTPMAKEVLLDQIFLDIATKHAPTTATHFLQLTLLALAEHAQLPKAEIYRRVSLVAPKLTLAAPILEQLVGQLQETASFFTAPSTVSYEMDAAVLPIYQAINAFLAPQRLTPEAYVQLEAWLQAAVLAEQTPVRTSLQPTLDKVFPTWSRQQKQQLEQVILESLQATITQRTQKLADDWNNFIQASELPQEYNSPSALLGRWLDSLLAQPTSAASPRQAFVSQQLIKALQTHYQRKRLVASLPTQDLEKIVQLLTQTHSSTAISWLHHIDALWDLAGSTTVTPQDSKAAWWDAALANMVQKTPFQVQNWLRDSLVDFAGFLDMQPAALLTTLLAVPSNGNPLVPQPAVIAMSLRGTATPLSVASVATLSRNDIAVTATTEATRSGRGNPLVPSNGNPLVTSNGSPLVLSNDNPLVLSNLSTPRSGRSNPPVPSNGNSLVASNLSTPHSNRGNPLVPSHLPTQAAYQVLQQIQQQIQQSISQAAQKDWPTQPALQKLQVAFTQGLGNLQDGTKLEKLVKQIDHCITHQADDFKKFLYTYPVPTSLSQQIVYHLPDGLVARMLKFLDPQAYPLIQQYTTLINLPPASFYQAQGVDAFSWRKQHELTTLNYLLDKQDAPFDPAQYVASTLNTWKKYHPQVQSTLRALTAYHRQHNNTPVIKQLIQQVEEALLLQPTLAEGMEERMNPPASILAPQVQITENATKSPHNKPDQGLKLYIKNSGLILIWPFIEELFTKQGLLEQGVFIDEIDHNNALHALQYVATEALSTPDWRLILNKLLVGMPYDEVTFAGYYLRDEKSFAKRVLEEQAAKNAEPATPPLPRLLCSLAVTGARSDGSRHHTLPAEVALLKKNAEELLTTVLGEWNSLQELAQYEPFQQGFGIQAFRQYILQREGMLQYMGGGNELSPHPPQGYWQLTITWEEHDSYIIKTPWPIDSIQLPFMRERVVVSWLPS